jgi:PQQ-like domain
MWKQFVAISASLLTLTGASADENWHLHGATQNDQRFSPLKQINEQTISRLGLVWSKELGATRGLEATPIVESGIIYTTGAWSIIYAFDAKTGQVKWMYDPKVPSERAYFFCCDVVNRGVALHNGKVYVGTLDGRLIALDQHTGAPSGATKPLTLPGPTPLPLPHASRTKRSLSVTQAGSTEFAATSLPTTLKPANKRGGSTPSPATRRRASNPEPWKQRPGPGMGRIGGWQVAEARPGKA